MPPVIAEPKPELPSNRRRPRVKQFAKELGCRYLDRPENRHAKAGNLNHALPLSESELIVCFDADFIPLRDFLQRTVAFLHDARVAMVQMPQNFFNEVAVTRTSGWSARWRMKSVYSSARSNRAAIP